MNAEVFARLIENEKERKRIKPVQYAFYGFMNFVLAFAMIGYSYHIAPELHTNFILSFSCIFVLVAVVAVAVALLFNHLKKENK